MLRRLFLPLRSGYLHFASDASAFLGLMVLASQGRLSYERAIIYNLAAFALQFPLGAWFSEDGREGRSEKALSLSFLFTALALVLTFLPLISDFPIFFLALGSAVQHPANAGSLWKRGERRILDLAIFMATGALGVALGLQTGQWMKRENLIFLPLILMVILFLPAVFLLFFKKLPEERVEEKRPLPFWLPFFLVPIFIFAYIERWALQADLQSSIWITALMMTLAKLLSAFLPGKRYSWRAAMWIGALCFLPYMFLGNGWVFPARFGLLLSWVPLLYMAFCLCPEKSAMLYGLGSLYYVAGHELGGLTRGGSPATFLSVLFFLAAFAFSETAFSFMRKEMKL